MIALHDVHASEDSDDVAEDSRAPSQLEAPASSPPDALSVSTATGPQTVADISQPTGRRQSTRDITPGTSSIASQTNIGSSEARQPKTSLPKPASEENKAPPPVYRASSSFVTHSEGTAALVVSASTRSSCDIVTSGQVEGVEFIVDRILLERYSPRLAEALANSRVVVLEGVQRKDFEVFLDVLYPQYACFGTKRRGAGSLLG
jgi:hypothetical protein